jgi:hypothetical protein
MYSDSTNGTPKLQTVSRKDFWQRQVDQWRTSGLSKMAYCQQHGLTYHQIMYWSSKVECVVEAKSPGGFVGVTVSSDERDFGLSIRFPNGVTIEGINERSVDIVSKLIARL